MLLPETRRLLAESGTTDAWAVLVKNLVDQLGDRPGFMAEMLARLAIVFVENES